MEEGPNTTVTLSHQDVLKYYKDRQMIRKIETAAGNLYKEKIIRGFCHLHSGQVSADSNCPITKTYAFVLQEACCVGMKASMRSYDTVITAYRAHGWTYMINVDAVGVLAELTGRSADCVRGKGGSMHMYVKSFYGDNGIVGAQQPMGSGIALALKYQGIDYVLLSQVMDGRNESCL